MIPASWFMPLGNLLPLGVGWTYWLASNRIHQKWWDVSNKMRLLKKPCGFTLGFFLVLLDCLLWGKPATMSSGGPVNEFWSVSLPSWAWRWLQSQPTPLFQPPDRPRARITQISCSCILYSQNCEIRNVSCFQRKIGGGDLLHSKNNEYIVVIPGR